MMRENDSCYLRDSENNQIFNETQIFQGQEISNENKQKGKKAHREAEPPAEGKGFRKRLSR